MSVLLSVRGLHKIHRRGSLLAARRRPVHAVNNVSFAINRGSILGLVGESGSGKSTLARALLYLDPPTGGEVEFDGRLLGSLEQRELRGIRSKMQLVFQDPNSALNPRLRVDHSVAEGLENKRVPRGEREKRVRQMLDLVGISSSRLRDYPHELSGGMKQRVCIARALVMEPQLLVLDEPVSSLDVSIQAQIINLLTDLQREFNLTYLFISHDINLVAYLCDEIGVMRRGELVELAPADQLLTRPAHEYTRQLLDAVPRYVDRRKFHHDLQTRSAV